MAFFYAKTNKNSSESKMIVQKEFLNRLKDFGLNTYESKLWTALLSRGISTAGELSDIANVPRSRSYDVLESLEKKGFIVMKLGKPIKYIAVPPQEVMERVKKRIQDDADTQMNIIKNLKTSEVLKELSLLHNEGIELVDPSELSTSIRGRTNLYNHIESTMKNSEKSIIIMTTAEGLLRKAELLKPIMDKLKKKGVKIKIAAQITKENNATAKELSSACEIRHIDDIKARFCIVDGKEITFMLLDDSNVHPTYDAGVWVNTPFFTSTLENLFNNRWNKLKPFE